MSQQTGKRNEMVIDFVGKMECEVENMCRICGDCATNMIRIFEEEGLKQHLYEKLHRHFPEIEISEGNGFPSQVCNNCSSALSSWDDLYNTCMLVDKKLKAFLDNLERKQSCDVEKYIISVDMEPDNSPKVDEPEYSLIESEDIASDIVVESDSVFSYLDCSYENSVVSDCEERTEQDVCENKEDSIKEYVVDEDHINEFDGCVGFETDEMGVPKIDIEDETSPLLFQPALEYKKDSSHSELPFSEIDFSTALLDIDCSRQRMSCAASKSIANLDADQKKFEDAETLPERRRAEDAEIPDVPLNVEDSGQNIEIYPLESYVNTPTVEPVYIFKMNLDDDVVERIKNSTILSVVRCEKCDQKSFSGIHLKSSLNDTEKIYFNIFGNREKFPKPKHTESESLCIFDHKIQPVSCDMCNEVFESTVPYLWHKKTKHLVSRKQRHELEQQLLQEYTIEQDGIKCYKCDRCPFVCRYNPHALFEHYTLHSNEKRYCCNYCNKYFRVKRHLTTHIHTVHIEQCNQFTCDVCNKAFKQKKSLLVHKVVHTGEKPHKCNLCGKCFVYHSSLLRHRHSELGIKYHGCDVCGKRFAYKADLTSHKKCHVVTRQYRCTLCDKSFNKKSYLTEHLQKHEDTKHFVCPCGAAFKIQRYLRQHERRVHKILRRSPTFSEEDV